MKKLFIVLILSMALPVGAHAGTQPLPRTVICMEAAGYYGNLQVIRQNGKIRILGQQGFAHGISVRLGFPRGHEWSVMQIELPETQCQMLPNGLTCQGLATVNGSGYSQPPSTLPRTQVSLKILAQGQGHLATLALVVPTKPVASASVSFGDLGGCTFIL